MRRKIMLGDLTWTEFSQRLHKLKIIVLPTGSNEQHGPHLPLKTDIAFAEYVAHEAARKIYPKAVVAPAIPIGVSYSHKAFPGTLILQPETFVSIIFDVCQSLKRYGVSKIALINGHGCNRHPLWIAAQKVRQKLELEILVIPYWDCIPKRERDKLLESKYFPGHACEFETSLGLAVFPELVNQDAIDESEGIEMPYYERFLIKEDIEYSTTGIPRGDPTLATMEKGRKLVEFAIEGLAKVLEAFAE